MSATDRAAPTSYRELVTVLENLPLLLRETRRYRRMSLRATAADIPGVCLNTLSRTERGQGLHLSHAIEILKWIGEVDR